MHFTNYPGPYTLPKEKKRSKAELTSVKRTAASTEKYRAVKDYNPDQFSRSGHRRLELPLKEGDIVKVLGMLSFSEEETILAYRRWKKNLRSHIQLTLQQYHCENITLEEYFTLRFLTLLERCTPNRYWP